MKKRLILLALTLLLACTLTSCALLREPWPANGETPAATITVKIHDDPTSTPVPTSNPVTDPDYNG